MKTDNRSALHTLMRTLSDTELHDLLVMVQTEFLNRPAQHAHRRPDHLCEAAWARPHASAFCWRSPKRPAGTKRALAPSSRPPAMAASPYTTCYRPVQRPPSRIDMVTLAGGEGWRMVEQQAC